jgi:hypothetical protein
MERFVEKFWTEEDGNTTVDWMVLTAGLVLLGAALMASVSGGSTELSEITQTTLQTNASL